MTLPNASTQDTVKGAGRNTTTPGEFAIAVVNPDGSSISKSYSTITNSRPTVTTSSTLILAANASRKYAGGFNQSGGVIFVKFGAAAVVGEGIRVTNNEPIIIPDGFTGNVYAIKNAGTGAIEMAEGT